MIAAWSRKLQSKMSRRKDRKSDLARPVNSLIGISGVHHVASELSRRGLIALPTTRNVAGYDIVVTTLDGRRHANIQVKTSSKRASFFHTPPSVKVNAGSRSWYVLLRWLKKENRFEGFMISGRKAREEVARGERFQKKRIKAGTRQKIVPSIYVARKVQQRADQWRKKWLTWKL
jgi:hypothetical protein